MTENGAGKLEVMDLRTGKVTKVNLRHLKRRKHGSFRRLLRNLRLGRK